MQAQHRLFAPFDLAFIAALLAAAFLSAPRLGAHTPETVAVYRDNTLIARYRLGNDKNIVIEGREGPMTIEILNESVRTASSTCRHQICVNTPAIRRVASQIVCAPNHVVIQIESGIKDDSLELDAISR